MGLGGDDRLYGQNDRLEESHGGEKYLVGDRLAGGPGDDLLDGGVDDRLLGSSGPDMLTGADGGADRVRGDAGNDHVEAGGGADDLRGGPGADWIADFGWHCADTIHGGPGDDWVTNRLSAFIGEYNHGGRGHDIISSYGHTEYPDGKMTCLAFEVFDASGRCL